MKKKTLDKKQIPTHVVLLPDGNRRWARERGLPTIQGHLAGFENIKRFCRWCQKKGIKVLTAFGFSTENWNRPKEEVKYLLELLERGFREELKKYLDKQAGKNMMLTKKVRVRVIGQKERLPKSLREVIKKIEDLTKNNKEYFLNLAVSYSGRWDILEATKKIIKEKIPASKITEKLFEKYLSTAGLPAPDLVIRTSGEKRFSNFLLWQSAYSELYFCDKYWPDFKEEDFDRALEEYARRQRRFGR
ncbi:di-trans,poly-cis-decaprenylcistransferase [bacterium]|nr:di-trans,poly-cis-decaprenylcistransferase [bacterium]